MITSEKIFPWLSGFVLGVFILITTGSAAFFYIFKDRIYPGVTVANLSVSGLTTQETQNFLQQHLKNIPKYQISLAVDDIEIASSSTQLNIAQNFKAAATQAYQVGRNGSFFHRIWQLAKLNQAAINIKPPLFYDQTQLKKMVNELAQQVNLEGHNPQATLKYSGYPTSLKIDPGVPGREVKVDEAIAQLNQNIGAKTKLAVPVASTSSVLNQTEAAAARKKAAQLINTKIVLTAPNIHLDLNDQDLVSLLAFPEGINKKKLDATISNWQKIVNRPAQEPKLEIEPKSLHVTEFVPPRDGLELNAQQTDRLLTSTIAGIHDQANIELELPVKTTHPQKTLAQTNDLGINELIGFGDSEYNHSIPNRIHNVAITTKKINNTLVPPGEEFSFNKTLGEVSARTGYKSAYVIKDGKTELSEGGGVCQVSTTTFRAVLDAGLQVTRRLPHSYRVSYYELNSKPGIDATVYSGNVDLRFINDTDHYILIHGEADSENLYMKIEIYGTSDGRTTEIKDHQVWGYVPPLPTQYIPDPSLPKGVKRQIDWSVAGVKAKFTHVIRDAAGNITHEETYNSNYRPWAAKYLVGI